MHVYIILGHGINPSRTQQRAAGAKRYSPPLEPAPLRAAGAWTYAGDLSPPSTSQTFSYLPSPLIFSPKLFLPLRRLINVSFNLFLFPFIFFFFGRTVRLSTSCFSLGMDSDHLNGLMVVDEMESHWARLGDSLPHVPPLRSWSGTDALVPFPESLDRIDDLHGWDPSSDNSAALVPYQHHSLPPLYEILAMGNINLDSFTRDSYCLAPHYGDAIGDIAPLNMIAGDVYDGKINNCYPFEPSKVDQIEERIVERRTNERARITDIGFDEMKNYFCMPISRAAKEMNVGLTVLKKRCRELGIARWPHRKMKSLMTLIHNVQEMGKGESEESVKRELERLEEHRRLIEENPEIELSERTKKLRQACFKANYKRRKALRNPSFDFRNVNYA